MYQGQCKPGTDLGPQVLRDAGLNKVIEKLGWDVKDKGDISEENVVMED